MKASPMICLAILILLGGCVSTNPNRSRANDGQVSQNTIDNVQLASAYLQRDQYEAALQKLHKALDNDPDYAPAHTVMALLQERLGDMQKAGEHYRLAAELDLENGGAQNNYGTYLCRLNKPREAEKYFQRALDNPLYRSPEVALANAGTCELESGNQEKSELYLRKALEYRADYSAALLPLAQIHYDKGEYLNARAFLQRFESAAEVNMQSLLLGYRIESELGNEGRVEYYRDELMSRDPEIEL
jgi:type IV pilus assembly protein PilF